jgi:hypothetical protein
MKILLPLLPCCLFALAHAESLVVETPMIFFLLDHVTPG